MALTRASLAATSLGFALATSGLGGQEAPIPAIPATLSPALSSSLRAIRGPLVDSVDALNRRGAAFSSRCGRVLEEQVDLLRRCRMEFEVLSTQRDSLGMEKVRFATLLAAVTGAQASEGNALILGTSAIGGYRVRLGAKPEVVRRSRAALVRFGIDPDSIDADDYQFIVGLAMVDDFIGDLSLRVLADQLTRGRATAHRQVLYAALGGRQFERVDCHSNGTMVCLAALASGHMRARHVRLLGPQLSREALLEWQRLLRERRIERLTVLVHDNDPIPTLSHALSDAVNPVSGTIASYVAGLMQSDPAITFRSLPCERKGMAQCHSVNTYQVSLAGLAR